MKKIITRFAPSPTGTLHLGGARTALFSYLFARANEGKFILRIDDTDQERSNAVYIKQIIEGLSWLDIEYDEIIYQSERKQLYQFYLDILLDNGKAYKHEGAFWLQCPESITWLERGKSSVKQPIQDFVICRSDGTALYNFASVVDDMDCGITHIIRGSDHISNTAKQEAIFQAFKALSPMYIHIPLIHDDQGNKLSKRNDAIDILYYRDQGYISQAVNNYLLRLGFAHKDKELFSKKEMLDTFNLEGIGKSSARFDTGKLIWFNKQYLKSNPEIILQFCNLQDHLYADQIAKQASARLSNLKEIKESLNFLYSNDNLLEKDSINIKEISNLTSQIAHLNQLDFSDSNLYQHIKTLSPEIIFLLAGNQTPYQAVDILRWLGKEKVINLLNTYNNYFQALS